MMIDGHCHLDRTIADAAKAMAHLHKEAKSARVGSIVLLNLQDWDYSNAEVIELAKDYGDFFKVFASVNPSEPHALKELRSLKASGAAGLKLHPRLHQYAVDGDKNIALLQEAGALNMPVMIDCFPDGKNLAMGNTPEAFARLGEKVSQTRIAIGHAGGHRILDALMVAKYYKNFYLDLSYSLLYYRYSSVPMDIAYAIRSIRAERIFWGSDYPDRPYGETVRLSQEEFKKMNLNDRELDNLLKNNVQQFLSEAPVELAK